MQKRAYNDAIVMNAVQKAVVEDQHFSDCRIANLRHDPPSFCQGRQARGCIQRASKDASGGVS
jgi:hypothetical protein